MAQSENLIKNNNQEDYSTFWDQGSSKDISIKYKYLDEIVDSKSMRYSSIPLPDFHMSTTVEAYNSYYNAKTEKNIVTFSVEGRPCDSSEGKKLVAKSFKKVKDVLKSDYKPETATIVYKDKTGHTIQERHIKDCLIVGVELGISNETKQVILRFTLQGILERG